MSTRVTVGRLVRVRCLPIAKRAPEEFSGAAVSAVAGSTEANLRVLDTQTWRRLDRLTRLSALAALEAVDDAGLGDTDLSDYALLVATERGPVDSYAQLHDAVLSGRRINPALFPRLVVTACAGSVAEYFNIHGPVVTFTSGLAGTLAALRFARCLVARGTDGAVVIGADVAGAFLVNPSTDQPSELSRWTALGDCAAALVLQNADTVASGAVLDAIELEQGRTTEPWALAEDSEQTRRVLGAIHWREADHRYCIGVPPTAPSALPSGDQGVVELTAEFGDVGAASPALGLAASRSRTGSTSLFVRDDLGAIGGVFVTAEPT